MASNLKLPSHLNINEDFEFELQRYVYKTSYYEFFKKAFSILNPSEPFNDNWHIKYLCDTLQDELKRIGTRRKKTKDIIINVPFRSSKSLITSVCFLPFVWITYPSLKFIYVSYSENLALEHAQFSKNLIASNWYQNLFGDSFRFNRSEDSKHFYANTNGGFRKSTGTGGQITGSGADFLIVDDGQNPQRAGSEKERYNTNIFWDATLYSRLNDSEIGVRINIQQRLHEDDLTGHLLKTNPDEYKLIKIPAEITDKNKCFPPELEVYYKNNLFWESRFSKKVIENYTKTLGSLQSAGQLGQLPAPEEGNLILRKWFDIIDPSEITRDINNEPINFYLDTAETEKQVGDPTAILTCFKKDNCIYIVDVISYHKEFYKSCEFIKDYVYKMRYTSNSKIKIEPKSSGKSIVSQLKNTTQLNVVELPTPKDDKLTRLKSIQPILESRRIVLVQGAYIEKFLDEICTFPQGSHDDKLDVLVYAVSDLLVYDGFDFMML